MRLRKVILPLLVILCCMILSCTSVRVIETNSFRGDSGPLKPSSSSSSSSPNSRQQKLVESLAIFNSEPKYVDSSEIRQDDGAAGVGPFFPIQFPPPIKYDQSNAIRYQEIDRDNTESTFTLGNIDIGDAASEASTNHYISPLLNRADTTSYRTPLISRTRDIEIYHQQNHNKKPYSGESIDIEMFDSPLSSNDAMYSDSGENHPGPINFSTVPGSTRRMDNGLDDDDQMSDVGMLTEKTGSPQYVESNLLRRFSTNRDLRPQNQMEDGSDRVTFGVIISTDEGKSRENCFDRDRDTLTQSLKDILKSELIDVDDLKRKTGVSLDLSIVDECDVKLDKESINKSYILLTNSKDVDEATTGAILNVSNAYQMSQFEKALGKVGITKYHHLTIEEITNNDDVVDVLITEDIDTVISDVHGHDLELLIDKLSGVPEKASKYTWIFTSILTSEMLLKIEQLLSRTKVVSIFATDDKKLLHNAVRVKDNAVQISAMETSLPYLYMLRQLRSAYLSAWSELCDGRRGKCPRLSQLPPRQFIQTYFNPSISARRKMPISFMLIVYRSSAMDDYLDLEIPGDNDMTSTVSAVMSTVENDGTTMVPRVVITQTVSTINFTDTTTTKLETTPTITTEIVTTTTNDDNNVSDDTEEIIGRCNKYNACVVYLIQENDDNEMDITEILAVESGMNRRSGLSVGTTIIPMEKLFDVIMPRNTIATVTVSEKVALDMMYPDMYNYNLAMLSQQTEDEMITVNSVVEAVTNMVTRLGWDQVVVVMFNTGITQLVTDTLVTRGSGGHVCVRHVIQLNMNYLASPAWKFLVSMYRREEQETMKMIVISQTTDQVVDMMHNLSEDLDWDTVRSRGHYLAWSYLQTHEYLAQLAEDLPYLRLYLLAESGEAVDTSSGPVGLAGGLMTSLGDSLSDYSARHCPDTRTVLSCVHQFRSHLTQHGAETVAHIGSINYNILRLNDVADGVFGDEEPLYVLAGEWSGNKLTMYETERSLEDVNHPSSGGQCLNSTEDYTAQLSVMIQQSHSRSNLETLWGSIALGICIFGVLIVIISAFYFIIAVNRKQKSEFGSSKDHTRLVHYLMILGLIILFLSPIPWVIRVDNYTCILRHVAPTLAFSIVLSSLLVNLIATFRQTIYTVTPSQVSSCVCGPTLDSARGLVVWAILLTSVQMVVTGVDIGLHPPTHVSASDTCLAGHHTWQWHVATYTWLLLLTLVSVSMCVACLKYDVTNRDAKWGLVCLISLTTIWVSWLVVIRLLDPKFQDPVCVMALVVSALLVLLCLYARKLYEFTEFGKADTKLELMSNIMLSDSPTDSQAGSRHYGSSMSILPGIIAMPEEDNSILGESVYQHLRYEEREAVQQSHVDLKMFEHQGSVYPQHPLPQMPHHQPQHHQEIMTDDRDSVSQSEYGDWSREDIYQSISRGVSYKPVLKKIGSRHMLVLNNQQTLSRGSTSKI